MASIDKHSYAHMFGPTVGDRIRLADTDLWIEVEKDFTEYGEEVTFGGGKVIRDGMGQSQAACSETVDLVITEKNIIGNLVGTWAELTELMELAHRGLVDLTTKEYALSDANLALRDLHDGKIRGRAVLIP